MSSLSPFQFSTVFGYIFDISNLETFLLKEPIIPKRKPKKTWPFAETGFDA